VTTKLLLRSFAGGEITPELNGRIDLGKFQTGLGLARNFITLPHGPAARRPGTRFIIEAKDSTHKVRLIPFQFSADQTAVLEFGHQYIRFHIDGGTLLEGAVAIDSITGATSHRAALIAPGLFGIAYSGDVAQQYSGMGLKVIQRLEAPYQGKIYLETTLRAGAAIADTDFVVYGSNLKHP